MKPLLPTQLWRDSANNYNFHTLSSGNAWTIISRMTDANYVPVSMLLFRGNHFRHIGLLFLRRHVDWLISTQENGAHTLRIVEDFEDENHISSFIDLAPLWTELTQDVCCCCRYTCSWLRVAFSSSGIASISPPGQRLPKWSLTRPIVWSPSYCRTGESAMCVCTLVLRDSSKCARFSTEGERMGEIERTELCNMPAR